MLDAAAARSLIIGAMVGVGIFLAPGRMARALPSAPAVLALVALGALGALGGALAYARWAHRVRQSGGDAVFHAAAFGPPAGLVVGLLLSVGAFCGSIAALASALATWQLPAALGLDPGFAGVPWPAGVPSPAAAVGVGVVLVLSAVQAAGLGPFVALLRPLAALPVVLLGMLSIAVLAGLAVGLLPLPVAPEGGSAPTGAGGVLSAWLGAHFAFAGWTAAAYVAGGLADPGPGLRRASMQGVLIVGVLYLVLVAALIGGLGVPGLAAAGEAGSALAARFGGPVAARMMAALIGMGVLGTIHVTIYGGAQLLAAWSARAGVRALVPGEGAPPRAALAAQAGVTAALVGLGHADALLDLVALVMVSIGCTTVGALLWVEARERQADTGGGIPWVGIGLDLPLILLHWVLGLISLVVAIRNAIDDPAQRLPALVFLLWCGLWLGAVAVGRWRAVR